MRTKFEKQKFETEDSKLINVSTHLTQGLKQEAGGPKSKTEARANGLNM